MPTSQIDSSAFNPHTTKSFLLRSLAVAVSLMSVSGVGTAQESDNQIIDEIVVTGTASGGGLRKFAASYAITNVNEEDILRFSPKSTADLLKTIPGVWSESSGGESGANVFVRGFPGGGDAPFLTVQLEGAPVFPPPTVSFLENTTLFRVDETVLRMEGLRGGPQSVQDNGQPGLTTNFLLKQGGEDTTGIFKYTTSDYDLQRVDGVVSGPLGNGLYYMVGGYIKSSPGIRDTGFDSEKGKQITGKLTKDFEDGSISVYSRRTDDHGVWFLPVALNARGVDNEYTQIGRANRRASLQFGPSGQQRFVDLEDGRGWDGSISGLNINWEINDLWTLNNNLNYTQGDADTVGLVPQGGAVMVGALLANPAVDPGAAVTGPITGRVTGRAIQNNEFIQQFGVWEVRKDIDSYTNNLALTGAFTNVDLTLGLYTAQASINEWWSIGNQEYQVVRDGGEVVNGIACNDPAVDTCGFNFDLGADGESDSRALYVAGTYHATDDLSFDIGVRNENHQVDYAADEGLDGVITKTVDYDESENSYTLGANYNLNENQGIFGRYSDGVKFPYFDDFRDNFTVFQNGEDLIQEVTQYELGYKAVFQNLSLYATAFFNEVVGDSFTPFPGAPTSRFTNEAMGLELDGKWFADGGFEIAFNATIQKTEITDSVADNGNEAQRQPGYMLRVSPAYNLEFGNGTYATLYGTVSLVDDRFADNGNTVVLDSYEKLDLGIIISANENLTLQLAADNVTDEEGLTEGDPRDPTAPNGRFILPRSIKLSAGYTF